MSPPGLRPSSPRPNPAAVGRPSGSPSVADQVDALLSLSLTDWWVSAREQRQIVNLLRGDGGLNGTMATLQSRGRLRTLLSAMSEAPLKRELLDILAVGVAAGMASAIRTTLEDMDIQVAGGPMGAAAVTIADNLWQVRFNLVRLGVPSTGSNFNTRPYAQLISRTPTAPFTGSGATGVSPSSLSVPLVDQARMLAGDAQTRARYSNPLPGDLSAYLGRLSPADRAGQPRLMFSRPVSTVMPTIWGSPPPTRLDVIKVAARRYALEPELVAAFLLAEQRDQSQLEDAKDVASAVNAGHNASLGLGQVVISTARNNRLFSDALSDQTVTVAGHAKIARLLTDDVLNIFAAAKYIRQVGNEGAARDIGRLRRTRAAYPGINMRAYGQPSARWPADNIRALGSEYTSRAWDDNLSEGWGYFVYEAYRDVRASGVFN